MTETATAGATPAEPEPATFPRFEGHIVRDGAASLHGRLPDVAPPGFALEERGVGLVIWECLNVKHEHKASKPLTREHVLHAADRIFILTDEDLAKAIERGGMTPSVEDLLDVVRSRAKVESDERAGRRALFDGDGRPAEGGSPRTGMQSVGDAADDVLGALREDAARRGAPAPSDLVDDCATCGGPVKDGVCLLQECDVVTAPTAEAGTLEQLEELTSTPTAPADPESDEAWQNSAHVPPAEPPAPTVEELVDDDVELAKARVSVVIDAVANVADLGRRAELAAQIHRSERQGKARSTLLAALAELAGDRIPKAAGE